MLSFCKNWYFWGWFFVKSKKKPFIHHHKCGSHFTKQYFYPKFNASEHYLIITVHSWPYTWLFGITNYTQGRCIYVKMFRLFSQTDLNYVTPAVSVPCSSHWAPQTESPLISATALLYRGSKQTKTTFVLLQPGAAAHNCTLLFLLILSSELCDR